MIGRKYTSVQLQNQIIEKIGVAAQTWLNIRTKINDLTKINDDKLSKKVNKALHHIEDFNGFEIKLDCLKISKNILQYIEHSSSCDDNMQLLRSGIEIIDSLIDIINTTFEDNEAMIIEIISNLAANSLQNIKRKIKKGERRMKRMSLMDINKQIKGFLLEFTQYNRLTFSQSVQNIIEKFVYSLYLADHAISKISPLQGSSEIDWELCRTVLCRHKHLIRISTINAFTSLSRVLNSGNEKQFLESLQVSLVCFVNTIIKISCSENGADIAQQVKCILNLANNQQDIKMPKKRYINMFRSANKQNPSTSSSTTQHSPLLNMKRRKRSKSKKSNTKKQKRSQLIR